jgi:hypothetical protein
LHAWRQNPATCSNVTRTGGAGVTDRTESGSGASPIYGLKMLGELTGRGNAVLVFEHKHEVIKTADCG